MNTKLSLGKQNNTLQIHVHQMITRQANTIIS